MPPRPALPPADVFATPQHGKGPWAPAIRHHAGRFWIYFPEPDLGIYVVTATDPAGPWSEPALVKAGKGLTITDQGTSKTGIAFALISHGPTGSGAWAAAARA